jgi:hypothetical protein
MPADDALTRDRSKQQEPFPRGTAKIWGKAAMMQYFNEIYYQLMHYANRLSPQQWVIGLTITLLIGIFCLRGYGSRSNY